MSARQGKTVRLALAGALAIAAMTGQGVPAGPPEVAVEVPDGVPLQVVSSDFADSDAEARGGALVIELSGSIRFRHAGNGTVRAVTLAVSAHEGMLGGNAAVAAPSLHAPRGEEFAIPVHLRMLRPLPLPPGPVVRIEADAVLLASMAVAGPDRLDSARKMRARETEARRDRTHFLALWRQGGRTALGSAMQASLRRQAARPRLAVSLAGGGAATAAAGDSPREVRVALLQAADAPLVLERGTALVTATATDAPRILLRNAGPAIVRSFELGWIVHDSAGRAYSAGSAPVDGSPRIEAGQGLETGSRRRFELRRAGERQPLAISGMSAYLRSAQLDDGTVWVPSRSALESSRLLGAIPVSVEEQRLSEIYRSRGPDALSEELLRLAPSGAGQAPR